MLIHKLMKKRGQWFLRILAIFHNFVILLYIGTITSPGILFPLGLEPSVGYRWIPLDPQGVKTSCASRISGPDHRGRRQQVPGGPEPGHHQELIFGQSCWNKSCWGWLSGMTSTFSGHPGPSGWGPAPKTPRCRARARTSPESEFFEKLH